MLWLVLKFLLWAVFIGLTGACLWVWYSVRSAPIYDEDDWGHDGEL